MKLRTTLNLSPASVFAAQYEIEVEITFTAQRGCAATYGQPGEADSVSIEAIAVIVDDIRDERQDADWLVALLEDDDDINAMCLQDWREREIDAAEQAAEQRAEFLRDDMERDHWDSSL